MAGEILKTLTRDFTFQSYFSDALLEKAILPFSLNDVIVASTLKQEQVAGGAVVLNAWSQAPVTIIFRLASGSDSAPVTLKPGALYKPPQSFTALTYGLPFGWLGGGLVSLSVLSDADNCDSFWTSQNEIMYHRARYKILDPATVNSDAPFNWPQRFPWPKAYENTTAARFGQPQLVISEPTRIMVSLRLTALGAPATMRILFQAMNDMGQTSTGAADPTAVQFVDYTWPSYAAAGVAAGNLATAYPVVELDGPAERFGADSGGIRIVDLSGGSLAGQYVDICRYGRF